MDCLLRSKRTAHAHPTLRTLVAGLLLAATFGVPAIANAQTSSTPQPLSIPTHERWLCKTEQPTDEEAKGGVRTHMKIEIEARTGFGGRTDEVWYDSAGRVLSLVETMTFSTVGTETTMDAITSSFAPTGKGAGSHMHFSASQGSPPTHATAPLTAEELKKIRALADWLWAHRCPDAAAPRS